MRELIINIKCDRCSKELREGDECVMILQTATKTYEADLCEECERTWTYDLRVSKQRRGGKSSTVKDFPCPTCGKLYGSQRGVSYHMTVTHGAGRKSGE